MLRTFSRDDTKRIKGVAILFMLFLHLFNSLDNFDSISPLFYIGDEPLLYMLTEATSPVGFFVFLSGYGLYISYLREAGGNMNNINRIKKLYVHYWITLAVFVPLGMLIKPDIYPGDFLNVVENVTGWHTTYNDHIWFLFPYVMLVLTAKGIFLLIDRFNAKLILIITYALYINSIFLISAYGRSYLYSHQASYLFVVYFNLLFDFVLGSLTAKLIDVGAIRKKINGYVGGGILLLLIIIMVLTRKCHNSIIGPFYTFFFVLTFVSMNIPRPIAVFLHKMGDRSTSIWFIHGYFCSILFKDFIYGFQYPIVIFTVLTLVSYCSAIIIDILAETVKKSLK